MYLLIFGRGWFLWQGWPLIHKSIWEGIEIHLSTYIWKGMAAHLPIYIYPFTWQGMATHLPMYRRGVWNLSTHLFGRGCENLPIDLGGDDQKFIYPFGSKLQSIHLFLGGHGHSSTIYFRGVWNLIYRPIHLGAIWTLFIFLSIWERVAIHPPIYLKGDGHKCIHILRRESKLIHPSIYF